MPAFIDASPQLPCYTYTTNPYYDITPLDWYFPLNLLSFIIKAHHSLICDLYSIYLYTISWILLHHMQFQLVTPAAVSFSFINNWSMAPFCVFISLSSICSFPLLRSRIKHFCLYQNHFYKNNKKSKKLELFCIEKTAKTVKIVFECLSFYT